MAVLVREVLLKHGDTLSQMLVRLELVWKRENFHSLKDTVYGYIGETYQVLCTMQHIVHKVAPDEGLSGPYSESDLGETEKHTLDQAGEEAFRLFAAYGVIKRYKDILGILTNDVHLMERQIISHTQR